MEIKIIPLGSDDKPLDSYGQDGQSFAETYAPIVELLLRESRLHAVVHTVPGGPAMAQADPIDRLIDAASSLLLVEIVPVEKRQSDIMHDIELR